VTTIKTFADELAAVVFTGVTKRYAGIPKVLADSELPAQWVMLPRAVITPENAVSTFEQSAARYTCTIFIAIGKYDEAMPTAQRTAVLDMAVRVEEWAIRTPYTVTIETMAPIAVAARQYRGVVAQVEADDLN